MTGVLVLVPAVCLSTSGLGPSVASRLDELPGAHLFVPLPPGHGAGTRVKWQKPVPPCFCTRRDGGLNGVVTGPYFALVLS